MTSCFSAHIYWSIQFALYYSQDSSCFSIEVSCGNREETLGFPKNFEQPASQFFRKFLKFFFFSTKTLWRHNLFQLGQKCLPLFGRAMSKLFLSGWAALASQFHIYIYLFALFTVLASGPSSQSTHLSQTINSTGMHINKIACRLVQKH